MPRRPAARTAPSSKPPDDAWGEPDRRARARAPRRSGHRGRRDHDVPRPGGAAGRRTRQHHRAEHLLLGDHRPAGSPPGLAVAVLAGISLWTAVAVWAYDQPSRRRAPLLVADLVVTVAAILITPLVKGGVVESTVPGFWVMGVVLAWGIHGHWLGGLIASLAVSIADVAIRSDLTQTNYGNIFLLMIGGPVLGYTSGLLKEMAAARDRAEREAAAAAERARLARAVHDGVLQVLALVQRRGRELGGEAAELGRLAGEQEAALRALVQSGASHTSQGEATEVAGDVDLAEGLRALAGSRVTVSVPATPVEVPRGQGGRDGGRGPRLPRQRRPSRRRRRPRVGAARGPRRRGRGDGPRRGAGHPGRAARPGGGRGAPGGHASRSAAGSRTSEVRRPSSRLPAKGRSGSSPSRAERNRLASASGRRVRCRACAKRRP